jgi:hypothetical protein
MNSQNEIQILEINSDDYDDAPEYVYCPVCRKRVNDISEDSYDINPCPHLVFAYQTISGDYEYIDEGFEKKIEAVNTDELEDDGFLDILSASEHPKNMLVVDICYSGMACGPISYSVYIGFDCGDLQLEEKELDELKTFMIEQG